MAHQVVFPQHTNRALGFPKDLCSPFLNWGLGSGCLQSGQREVGTEVITDFW